MSAGRVSVMLRIAATASMCLVASCGSRPSFWDNPVNTTVSPYGLANGIVLVDDANHEAVVLTSAPDHTLVTRKFPIGHNFASATPMPDLSGVLLLSAGDGPGAGNEAPSLTQLAIGRGGSVTPTRFWMTQPVAKLTVDPLLRYAIGYQGDASTQGLAADPGQVVFTNPNEIVIFDLQKAPFDPSKAVSSSNALNPIARTLQSYGSSPQRLTFTPEMNLPVDAATAGVTAHKRRLLVVETKAEITLVDLDHAFDTPVPRPDITVRLSTGISTSSVTPAGLAVDTSNPDDGLLAERTAEDNNVYTIRLVAPPPLPAGAPAPANANDFTASPTLTDVGGNPSDIAFVSTGSEVRVAALVRTSGQAVLFRPDGSDVTPVALPSAYTSMSIVTNLVAPASPSMTTSTPADVALLWGGGGGSGVALWSLDSAVGQPYRSVEVLSVTDSIASVIDVPNTPLKVLTTAVGSTHSLYVLDLAHRTPSPIDTSGGTPLVSMAPDGGRFWLYVPDGQDLASIQLGTLATLNPTPVRTASPISSVFDIAACAGTSSDPTSCPRTVVALHAQGTFGATLFDALAPQSTKPQEDIGLLLEGP